jgi:hypothetical protein
VFLLSPANLSGKRGQLLLGGGGSAPLAEQLRSSEGAALGEVFSFVSSLYFRGKVAYAQAFGSAALVMTAGGGLCALDERLTLPRLQAWSEVSIRHDNPHFTAPLVRQATALLEGSTDGARFVLLGSVASPKYTVPLLEVFGRRLLFPVGFAGLGDMSRGSLLLKAVRDSRELEYRALGHAHEAALDSD